MAATRALAPASSALIRAAAPSALSAGLARSAGLVALGGHRGAMTPPERTLTGVRVLLRSCPHWELHSLQRRYLHNWIRLPSRPPGGMQGSSTAPGGEPGAPGSAPGTGGPGMAGGAM